jgi:hypothetical protein
VARGKKGELVETLAVASARVPPCPFLRRFVKRSRTFALWTPSSTKAAADAARKVQQAEKNALHKAENDAKKAFAAEQKLADKGIDKAASGVEKTYDAGTKAGGAAVNTVKNVGEAAACGANGAAEEVDDAAHKAGSGAKKVLKKIF